jgi:hypothetical protein
MSETEQLEAENTRIRKTGGRACRACGRATTKLYLKKMLAFG